MRKIVSLLLICVLILSMSVSIFAAEKPIRVIIKSSEDANHYPLIDKEVIFDVPPQIIKGRTMIPVRAVAEELGFKVDYTVSSSGEQTISFFKLYYSSEIGLLSFIPSKSEGLSFGKINVYDKSRMYRGFSKHMCGLIDKGVFNTDGGEMEYLWHVSGNVYSPERKYDESNSDLRLWSSNGALEWMKKTKQCNIYISMEVGNQLLGCVNTIYMENGTQAKWVTLEPMDVSPQIIGGRTLMPLRAFAEALGMEVTWDEDNRIVKLSHLNS